MSRYILPFILLSFSLMATAQTRMRDVFAHVPDTIFPLLTLNNRLDCIDFIENNMEARVKNKLDEHVVLENMTDNYLRIELSANSIVEMKLFSQQKDTFICVNRIYRGPAEDSEVRVYDFAWNMLYAIARPKVEDFLNKAPNSELNADTMSMLRQEAEYLPLIKATLSPEDETLTWTLQCGEFTKDIKKVADKYLQPVVVFLVDKKE